MINFDLEYAFFYAVIVTGVITLVDQLFWAKERKLAQKKMPWWIDWSRSFFPVLLIVFLFRSFLFEQYRIPTGSLKPSLLVGDFPLVNKFAYGVRLPILHKEIFSVGLPQRGDILVFRWPPNPSMYLIKRVIGVPGDHIRYVNKVLYINGQKIPQTFVENTFDSEIQGPRWEVVQKEEDLLGMKHFIYQIPDKKSRDFNDIVVPPGMYFAMGDNRDSSGDSRFWGFVPEKNIVGKAVMLMMSWDSETHSPRWNRIFKQVNASS